MKALILTVLVSFAAVSLNAAAPDNLKQNMAMNAAMSSQRTAQSLNDSKVVKFVGYSEFTKDFVTVAPKLNYEGKKIKVHFFEMDKALAFAYDKSKAYDEVEVKLSAENKDLSASDPHHQVPVYANITVSKNKKTIETAKVEVFSVQLHEIWDANRPVEPKYETSTRTGDPHFYEEADTVKTKPAKKTETVTFEDQYHRF